MGLDLRSRGGIGCCESETTGMCRSLSWVVAAKTIARASAVCILLASVVATVEIRLT